MSKGIIIATPKKYECICYQNVLTIRKLGCTLPIELWEIGKEISDSMREKFSIIDGVVFKDVADYTNKPSHWKGFQVKAFIFYHTSFEEVILCDADVIFHQNPAFLFRDEHYQETGTYFFKDLDKWKFFNLTNKFEQLKQTFFYKKFKNLGFFNKRKAWLRKLLPNKSSLFPAEWNYIYENKTPENPVKEALQESGVVAFNKTLKIEAVNNIFKLNENHKETYQYIWGDKETFWLGCVMANEPYYFNESYGYICNETGNLTHDYNNKKFFSQKGE